ncbi:MAG: glycosyltransferase family 4 protein [Deltaproteobacteria bacterium]|nr:glycosyltransferase family 4 protein [Deltaproteobacteria bacterium]
MPLRVAILLQHWLLGGAERQALHVARALQAKGHHLELWSLEGAHPGAAQALERARAGGLTTVDAGHGRSTMARVLAVSARLRARRIDVVLPFTVTPNLVAAASWRLGGARGSVWNQRDSYLDLGVARAFVARQATVYVSNAEPVRARVPGAFGVDAARCLCIPNILDPAVALRTVAQWRKALALAADARVIVSLARLHPKKRIDLAIRALAAMKVGASMVVAGLDQGALSSLREVARSLGVEGRVRFPGHVDDVTGLLAACDAGIYTSSPAGEAWGEGSSNAVLEVVTAGLPCVCVDDPAIRAFVDPADIAADTPAALAAALDGALTDPGARPRAAVRAEALRKRHAPEVVVPLWEEALLRAARARGTA